MADEKDSMLSEELARLEKELKKLKREIKHVKKDNELLRMANEQAARTQAYIQRENMRQIFFNMQLLRTSPYLLILTDEKLNTVMASDRFYIYSSYDVSSIQAGVDLNVVMSELLDDNNLDSFMQKCKKALSGTEIEPYIMHNEYNDKRMALRTSIVTMKQDGEVVGLNIIFVDMTEVIEARERADAANKAKSSFLANMSHEIRTPINAVLGMDEMILRESKEKDTLSYAEDIRAAGNTLLALINEILDFSKVEEGKMEIIPTKYELSFLISDIINMVRERANNKGLEFKTEIDENIPHELYGDEIRIKQCILNILNNAVKYTEKGYVKLSISSRPKDDKNIYLKFSIKDTGIGMKKEDMDKLFSPFSRIEEKRNRVIEGTGLGMSITKQLLNLMGTDLVVDSVYGMGSVFEFEVEQGIVNSEKLGVYAGRSIKRSGKSQRRKDNKVQFLAPSASILVVDDSEMNLRVISSLLKRTKVQIDTAKSGAKALEYTSNKAYDIVFVDHMMPGMDGIETLNEMKKQDTYESSCHIALTANAISGAREMYIAEGFDDYLSKPIDADILEKMMENYLPDEKIISRGSKEKSKAPESVSAKRESSAENVTETKEKTDKKPVEPSEKSGKIIVSENSDNMPSAILTTDENHNPDIPVMIADVKGASEKLIPSEWGNIPDWEYYPRKQDGTPVQFENIPILDTKEGIGYCGNEEIYVSVLRAFHEATKKHCTEIVSLYVKKDWKNYILEVHALKCSAHLIGAIRLYTIADELEKAAKEEDYEFIDRYTDTLLDMYITLDKELQDYDLNRLKISEISTPDHFFKH